jgi:hypothetical protein
MLAVEAMKFPEQYREQSRGLAPHKSGDDFGYFIIPGHKAPCRRSLQIIASAGDHHVTWQHVSVSLVGSSKTPTWEEMCFAKNLFWDESEWVIQYHPAKSHYINNNPGVLHLWKPTHVALPTPPSIAV